MTNLKNSPLKTGLHATRTRKISVFGRTIGTMTTSKMTSASNLGRSWRNKAKFLMCNTWGFTARASTSIRTSPQYLEPSMYLWLLAGSAAGGFNL
ncbi:hypothetical protein ONE63_004307 [Megalurothrips usitatus]|uniref:Uncharacterized protein n=1 Tax=Megalurothrips usitatus TaxID=439358 RepID=A0AAV7X5S7_9NEOP|nr:hypothetical protein ONE63_004307 [Megalurothrips usitatus]